MATQVQLSPEMLQLCDQLKSREMTADDTLKLTAMARQAGYDDAQVAGLVQVCIARMSKDIAEYHPELVDEEKRRVAELTPATFGGLLHDLGAWYDRSRWHRLVFWLILLVSIYGISHHWLQPSCAPDVVFGGCASDE